MSLVGSASSWLSVFGTRLFLKNIISKSVFSGQFLPFFLAMQEEVLRLILLTLSEGALIARKTLVMYIVQTLREDYPQVSKTSVGHVVQLLYRASCFNVFLFHIHFL